MEIEICVGSSCHLKGSYAVIKKLEEYRESHGLKETLVLKGSFCLGECTRGVSVKTGQKIYSMSEDNCIDVLESIMEVTHAAD